MLTRCGPSSSLASALSTDQIAGAPPFAPLRGVFCFARTPPYPSSLSTTDRTPTMARADDAFHVFDTTLRDGAQREGITYSVADKLAVAAAARRARRGLHRGRLARRDAQGHRVLRAGRAGRADAASTRSSSRSAPPARPGVRGAGRPAGAGAARLAGAGRRAWWRSPTSGTSSGRCARRYEENLAMVARHRRVPRRRGPPGLRRLRALLRRLRARPRLRRAGAARRRSRRAPTSACCATPTAACCRWASHAVVVERRWRAAASGSASTARTTPAARWPTPLAAVEAGATHVQCTANGYGERAGNADLFARRRQPRDQDGPARCCPTGAWPSMVRVSHAIAELANLAAGHPPALRRRRRAFAHKAGLHASAIKVDPDAVQPPRPGARRQRHAHPGHRDGRPRVASSSRAASSASTSPAGPTRSAASSTGQGAGGRRLVVRGGRRLVRAAAARRQARRVTQRRQFVGWSPTG